jgi:Domain of unknown function (DUF4281)
MDIDHVFLIANWGVLPFWLLLVVLPRAAATKRLVHSMIPCLLLAPLYGALLFGDRPGPQGASFSTLMGVTHIFTTPWTITACWIHYLIFDLFVGAWEVRDAERLGIRHAYVVPSVVLTLLFGPLGLLSYALLRGILRGRWVNTESAPITH